MLTVGRCREILGADCRLTDAEVEKLRDVVGLYLSPPENAVVLCVDEKPHIQVLERAQGWLRLPNGKALDGFSHCYKRHCILHLGKEYLYWRRNPYGHAPLCCSNVYTSGT